MHKGREGDQALGTREEEMKFTKLILIVLALSVPAFAGITSGDDLIAAMHKKYEGKWYRTLTFVQTTTTHKPDGTSSDEIWYEALSAPGRLRIDIDPLEKGNGIIFAGGRVSSFRDGKLAGGRPFVHPLLVLGFDVYAQPPAQTIAQLKGLGIDMSVIHEDVWQGRKVYVVGARAGDMSAPQFWVDKKNLYFVRLIELRGKDKKSIHETQFNKYYKVKGGGWVSPEVLFFTDGKLVTTETYRDIQTGVTLSEDLFNTEKWMTVDKTYFKKK